MTDSELLNMLLDTIDYVFLQTDGTYDKRLSYPVIDKMYYIKSQLVNKSQQNNTIVESQNDDCCDDENDEVCNYCNKKPYCLLSPEFCKEIEKRRKESCQY